jgi:hypothetical protein
MASRNEFTDSVALVAASLPSTAAATPYTATNLGVVPYDGTVTRVEYVPSAGITANGTNFQTLTIQNGGAGAAGTTTVATRAWSATNSTANTPEQAALSGTAANLEVKRGDVLRYVSAVSGSGVALPVGSVIVHVRPRAF